MKCCNTRYETFKKSTILLLPLLFAACNKEEIKRLPPITTSGANTIGALVNGKAWVAEANHGFNMKKISFLYSYSKSRPQKRFVLNANRITKDENSNIQLAVEDVKDTGTHYFSFDTNSWPGEMLYKNHAMYREYRPGSDEFITSSRHTGFVTFTRVDTVNHIIAGVFEFTAENLDGSGHTVKVTNGRFDINYRE